MAIDKTQLGMFLTESNMIEGNRGYSAREFDLAHSFINRMDLANSTHDLLEFAQICEPGVQWRFDHTVPNVRIGTEYPPKSGPEVADALIRILGMVRDNASPYLIHRAYLKLHPLTDCNGRSSRLLWLWQMVNQQGFSGGMSFLECHYRQSLAHEGRLDIL